MNGVLVIKVNSPLKQEDMDTLKEKIEEMKKEGVILLPNYCDIILVPEDTDVKVTPEEKSEHMCKYCDEKMKRLVKKSNRLYERPGWKSGGCLHVLLDDGNIDNDSINFCLSECKLHSPLDPAAIEGIDICNSLLKMSISERRVFIWLFDGWNGKCTKYECSDDCIYLKQ